MAAQPDTIVAIATPAGRGGIGVVRISGPAAMAIGTALAHRLPPPRMAGHRLFLDDDGGTIDEGLVLYFPAPKSYTGEDVIELHGHSSRITLNRLVDRAIRLGARLARPGEFTERAFHNGKIDLLQAEAVADLVDSVSVQAARSAIRSLEGEFSKKIRSLLEKLIEARVYVEGALDFPDEDTEMLTGPGVLSRLNDCRAVLDDILARARQGAVLREGVSAVITGRPNVGKSTLLNRLAGREAAIVTASPGTTRDLVGEHLLIDGVPVHLLDTAGLRRTGNEAELEGIRRARNAAAQADIVIVMIEYGQSLGAMERRLIAEIGSGTQAIVVHNKTDLAGVSPALRTGQGRPPEILLSAKTGEGVELLERQLRNCLGMSMAHEDVFLARQRHLDALGRARSLLENGLNRYAEQKAVELLADDLRLAQQALGEITGEFVSDDLLGEIFSRFCIGK